MKTQLKSLLWAGFFLFSMTQCNLCNTCIYKEFPPEVDLYFDFKEGSYWIYRNTTNGALDSLVVTTYEKQIGRKSSLGCVDSYLQQGLVLYEKNLTTSININLLSAPFTLNMYGFATNQIELKTLSALTIAGKTYQNTLRLDNCCSLNSCQSEKNTTMCTQIDKKNLIISSLTVAPNVGIIKWETQNHPIYSKATFELVRYKIIKP